MKTMDGEDCWRIETPAPAELTAIAEELAARGLRTYEADIRLTDAYLMDRSIHGSIRVSGAWMAGKHVDRVYVDPNIEPSNAEPILSIASIDIETNPFGAEIYAISVHHRALDGEAEERVLLCRPSRAEDRGSAWNAPLSDQATREAWRLSLFESEEAMLRGWVETIVELDPDIITGWNVVEFDFAVLARRFRHR